MNYANNQANAQILKSMTAGQLTGAGYAGTPEQDSRLGATLGANTSQDRPSSFLEVTDGRLNYILHELSAQNSRLYRGIERSIGSFPVAGAVEGGKGSIISATAHEIEAKLDRIYAEIDLMSNNISRVETII